MNKKTGNKQIQSTKPSNQPLEVAKIDVNLSRLPLFSLSRGELKEQLVREWIFTETRENKQVELVWRVMATPRYGYPGVFAKRIHRAVEYLLTRNGFPFPPYLDFSFYEI